MNYRILRTKLFILLITFGIALILLVEYYHYENKKKIFYDVSIEKLFILTKTMYSFEKRQIELYKARLALLEEDTSFLRDIKSKNHEKVQNFITKYTYYFKKTSPQLEHIHLYNTKGDLLYNENKNTFLNTKNFTNSVLTQSIKTKKLQQGYVRTSPNSYYLSIVSPLYLNDKIIAYQEFGIKAAALFILATKAGKYKYAIYLNQVNDKSKQSLGNLVVSNSKVFDHLNITQEFIYKYANKNIIVKSNDKSYLLFQYDIETPFQKNFSQVLLISNVTKYVQDNNNSALVTIEFAFLVFSILVIIFYYILTTLINKLIKEEKALSLQHNQIQAIMDQTDSLIVLFKGNRLTLVNNSMLDLTDSKDIKMFTSQYQDLSRLFIEDKDTYTNTNTLTNQEWIKELNSLDQQDRVVAIRDKKYGIKYFNIKTSIIHQEEDSLVLIFSNISSIFKKSKKDEYLANHDTLTGIYNRQYFNKIVNQDIYEVHSNTNSSALLMLDLDFFKRVNDTYGHQVGDDVLQRFTQVISKNIRSSDVFARWGGEEFILLLPNISIANAYNIADTLRKKIEETNFKDVGTVTCSIGISEFIEGDNLTTWLFRVDEALYKAKENGRNRVELI